MVSAQQVLLEFLGKDVSLSSTMSSAKGHMDSLEQSARKAGVSSQQIGAAQSHVSALGGTTATATGHMDRLNQAGQRVRSTLSSFSNVGGMLAGVFSVYTLYMWTQQAIEADAAWRRFAADLHVTDQGVIRSMKNDVYDLAQTYGFLTSQVRESESAFIARGSSYSEAAEETKVSMLIAAGTGKDLVDITGQIAGAEEGRLRAIQKITGLGADQLTSDGQHLDYKKTEQALNEKYAEALESQGRSDEANLIRAQNAISKIEISMGNLLAGPLSGVAGTVSQVADWFNSLDPATKSWAGYAVLGSAAFIGMAPFLAPALDIVTKMGSGFKTVLDRIGLINNTPCTPKECVQNMITKCSGGSTPGTVGGTTGGGAAGGGAAASIGGTLTDLAGPAALLVAAVGINEFLAEPARQTLGPLAGLMPTRSFGEGTLKGTPFGQSSQSTGLGSLGGLLDGKSPLDALLPKGASAAGTGAGGKPSFQQDLAGLFDMSRFHIKMPDMNVIPNAFKTSFNTAKNWTTQGINTVTGFIGGLPGRAGAAIMPVIGAVTGPFTQAWSQGEAIVWGGVNTVTGAFWSLYSGVDSSMQSMYNTIVNWTSQGIAMLQKLYCMVFGCSPGLLPAFRALGKEVPIHLSRTMPYLSAFSNSINNIPDVKMGSLGGGAGGVHYHVNNGSYTIDASHLSLDELEGLLIRLFEGKYKPNVTGGS